MKYKTLFRLMIRAIGVWVFAQSVGPFIQYFSLRIGEPASRSFYSYYMVGPLVGAVIGLYLFFGGEWIVNRVVPFNRPYCHECGYDLTGAIGNICTECGTPFKSELDDKEPDH